MCDIADSRSPLLRIQCVRGDRMEFLYIFGLMFLGIFGASMLLYPLLAVILNAAGRKSRLGTDKDGVKRNDKR